MRMEARVPLVVALIVVIALLGGGCGGDGEQPTIPVTSSTAAEQPSTEARSSTAAAQPSTADTSTTSGRAGEIARSSEQIDIGGRSLHLECWGERVGGEPTVLLIAGSGPPTSSWDLMASPFAAEGHYLCAYDRAGVGRSDPAPEARRTTQDQVTDMVALLDAAGLQEPVVLVAHSLGSLPAVGLVDRAPERVAGVVLVDPWSPRVSAAQRAALPPKSPQESPELAEERRFVNDYLVDPGQNREHVDLAASDETIGRLLDEPGPVFGDVPVVVLRAPPLPPLSGLPRRYHEATLQAMSDGYEEFAAESSRGTLVEVEDTGHNIQDDQPEVVMGAISDVLAASHAQGR